MKFKYVFIITFLLLISGCSNDQFSYESNNFDDNNVTSGASSNGMVNGSSSSGVSKSSSSRNSGMFSNYDKVSLNNNLFGDSTLSFFNGTDLKIVFTYNGQGRIGIDGSKSTVINSDGLNCNFQSLKNIDNGQEKNEIYFLPSQMGIITFNCNNFDKGSVFNKKNKFEGSLKILLKNPETESEVFSKGDIRLPIRE